MTERCQTSFDEKLISGHLDGELTQAADQRVRIHLETCDHCRNLYEELRTMREATMSTQFVEPSDEQWNERPRGTASLLSRSLGWMLAIVWLVAVTGFGLWHAWHDTEGLFERLLVFGGLAAFGLLLLSVLVDRIRISRTDRYREVEK
jgi:predicted anti-sigma-YlaC factor YlaD